MSEDRAALFLRKSLIYFNLYIWAAVLWNLSRL